jgi:cell wall-associated NlpC family hydrolase
VKRFATFAAACAVLSAPASTAAPAKSWALPQINVVTEHRVFTATPQTFRGDDPLTAGTLARVVAAIRDAPATAAGDPAAPVTLAQLDATLVRALGLADASRDFYLAARRVGVKPPSRFGTEVVARLLGLRVNHLAAQDALELRPNEPATRAEAAYSVAQILAFRGTEADAARTAADAVELPQLTPLQRKILQTAISFVGFPYVWGGENDRTERGFDCSGFVWRVYRLTRYAGAPQLAATLRGRTTFELSGEVPQSQRIALADAQPGDVLFFGSGGGNAKPKPKDVEHAGIYLGGGWMIHSSRYGVTLAPVEGWYRTAFAWARRPLAEAGVA